MFLRRKYKLMILLILLLALPIFFLFQYQINQSSMIKDTDPALQLRCAIISINGDEELANYTSIGDGTVRNPYVIEDLIITECWKPVNETVSVLSDALFINKTNAHLIIRNCIFQNGVRGIYLQNVSNIQLINNTINNFNDFGIEGRYCENITIIGNDLDDNRIGLDLMYSGNGQILKNSICYSTLDGILLQGSYIGYFSFSYNIINNNGRNGISLYSTNNNTFTYNTLINNNNKGVYVFSGENNTFHHNSIGLNGEYGITVLSNNNEFHDNLILRDALGTFSDSGTGNSFSNNDYGEWNDTDNDGLFNLEEINLKCNAFIVDTDWDNLDDKIESNYGCDPTKKDTDGDGFSDGFEIALGTNPLSATDYPGIPDPSSDNSITSLQQLVNLIFIILIITLALAIISISINILQWYSLKKE
ncbi:MAG: hypothetical protein EAX96_20370 [Candidatus Lokiarchaeota archaeon]|nr:hypothetical protein [Candidatus Lokiarchaeota archaeon]